MPKLSAFRSGAFRFALILAAVFAAGTIALLFLVERSVSDYATEVARDSVRIEVAVLREEDSTSGRAQTIRSIVQRENAVREHQLRYLLVDHDRRYLAGSLAAASAKRGWYMVTVPNTDAENDDGAPTMTLMALGATLPDGATLVVASDTSDLDELRWGLGTAAAGFGIAITLLALIGGLVAGTTFLRRLEGVNRSVERIMQGSIGERLPPIGMSAEFDHLTSNLNRMLDRIESLFHSVRQVSTDIAHDLRTPLTRLQHGLEATRGSASEAAFRSGIDTALIQIAEIHGIFRALLRIGLIEGGPGRQPLAPVNLSELVERVALAYQPVIEDAGKVASHHVEPGLSALGDKELLAQLLANLIDNALVHTPEGTRIDISLEQQSGRPVLTVADTGPGVPAPQREKILTRFYRLNASRHTPGAGLGLALVAAIAALHGADLLVEDNQPGLRIRVRFAAEAS